MDELLKKLKKRPSYPFETIAVAIAFSPGLEAIVTDAKRIADTLGANLILIHIGKKTQEKENRLYKLMDKIGIDENKIRITWTEGDTVDTILKLCKLNIADLLILGALQKENILRYYIGSVARKICRRAKCSVLLLIHPRKEDNLFKKIIVNGVDNPKTLHSINTALYLAKNFGTREITVVKELHVPALAMTMADNSTAPEKNKLKKDIADEETGKLLEVIRESDSDADSVKVNEKVITGKPGYTISKYARSKKAGLLVINSPDTHLNLLDRIFTHDIEYILADLPCNLLIIHSRV